jgi:hypothetical protein
MMKQKNYSTYFQNFFILLHGDTSHHIAKTAENKAKMVGGKGLI